MSVQEEKPPTDIATKLREMRNTDLVSRLLAATPPYLYSALPLQPHAFFFSEMLRSFVNARHGCRPPPYHRRFKRRTHKYFAENDHEWRRDFPKEEEKKELEVRPEVPLELTVEKQQRARESRDVSPKRMSPKGNVKPSSPAPERHSTFVDVGMEELPKPAPCSRNPADPANLILPPPPPMWYPPLYNPSFGVDPLNFFIDLRVSGHIYDRKRALAEGIEANVNHELRPDDAGLDKRMGREFGRPRHLSAFSVPVRSTELENHFDKTGKVNGTSYVMRNLQQVYNDLHSQERNDDANKSKLEETKTESLDLDDDVID